MAEEDAARGEETARKDRRCLKRIDDTIGQKRTVMTREGIRWHARKQADA